MPYKFETEKKRLPVEKDRRFKISISDREEINKLYKTGMYSQRDLAKMFNVSRRLITLYTDKDKLQREKENFKSRQKTGRYYDVNKQREYSQRTRLYKKELYKKGELV